ncbi:protein-disulfide reductase DsbD domain-containing protein [Rhizobium sp. S152]|uniref:protein-disulfide reductase DsbD domain-containing protein n=1 Tax=Rhizobium sp. S152 TaxID=3055038 RepID=UPI003FA6EF88
MKTIPLPSCAIPIAVSCLAAMLATSHAARAETSAWADNEGGRMRLVALAADGDGHIRAGLQIEPKPGWITYWREPGNAGIPPQVTVSTPGVKLDTMLYPVPKHIVTEAVDEVAYDSMVTLPLRLTATDAKPAKLEVDAFIGICKDICIPFQAKLSLDFLSPPQSRPEEKAILDAAEARLPMEPSSDFEVTAHALSPDMKELSLEITLPEAGETAPQVIVAGPSGYAFTKRKTSKRDGTSFSTTIAVGKLPRNYDVKGKTWSALVIDGDRAIETPLVFE